MGQKGKPLGCRQSISYMTNNQQDILIKDPSWFTKYQICDVSYCKSTVQWYKISVSVLKLISQVDQATRQRCWLSLILFH